MAKDEIYSKLLDKVQAEGGYLKIEKKWRPVVRIEMIHVRIEMIHVVVAAIFEMADTTSPLRLIDTNFNVWDVYDYLDAEDMERILSLL